MKKILFLIITLLFSSLATAENEAAYNEVAGSIEIPVLSVKGQAEKFSVTLQQEDTEDLIFTIIDATPEPEVESSTNEATYDPETGVVIIPSVMVLEEGNPSVKSYSVELQLTEESIFKISQAELILALPTNTFNGIPSETLDISVAEKASSGSSLCTGNPSQNLDAARQNFKTKCGEPWNNQKHVCEYKDADGFHCSGDVSSSTTPDPTNPTTSNPPATNSDWCTGTPDRNRDVAKRNFRDACGQTWNDQLGHVCENKADGWHCSGTTSSSDTHIPTKPSGVKATRWHPNIVNIEWYIENYRYEYQIVRGFDVFRNGQKIGFIARSGARYINFTDRNANGQYRYQIVAVSTRGVRSPSSSPVSPSSPDNISVSGDSIHSTRTGRSSIRANYSANGRSLDVQVTIRASTSSTGVSMIAQVRSNGVPLGSVDQSFNSNGVTTVTHPEYGRSTTFHQSIADPTRFAPNVTAEQFVGAFPDKPRTETQTPGGGDCEDCPPEPEPTKPVDEPGFFCPKGSSQEGENRCVPDDKLSHCVGPIINEQQPVEAKIAFGNACKTTYNDQLGHQCEWVADPQGWRCFK
ncbi:MAG: hypothetical protein V3U87_18045 [Methylococcaceae bacterium]